MSTQDRDEFREEDCPVCGRPIRWMRGADRPDCPYCGRRASARKPLDLDDLETEVLVAWK